MWASIAIYLAVWGASVGYLAFKGPDAGADWTFPFISLVIFGVGLSGITLFLSRGPKPEAPPSTRPGVELVAMMIYLAAYAVGFLGYGLGMLREAVSAGPAQEVAVLGVKLLVHVVAPAILLIVLGARIMPIVASGPRPVAFWSVLIVLGAITTGLLAVVSPSLQQISELNAPWTTLAWAGPASFIWIAIEAGLCEEFLFRGVLQTRAEAALKSPVAAIVLTSILFGLAHAPGLFLRGGPGVDGWSTDPVQVVAYTIATLSPLSILFGVIWMRTRSLLLCVLLHAAVDFLPNLAEFVRTWAS